ncbi:MAG: 4Fe-4S dicluster domain-containing protein [Thermoplasmata archaeon]
MRAIVPHLDLCTGCRMCEMVCSLHHEVVVNREWARIRVHRKGIDHNVPVICNQGTSCNKECAKVCPVECIRNLSGPALEVVREECTGCGECIEACPFDAIHMRNDIAFKCDLCNGDPTCMKFCSLDAITYEEGIPEEFERARDIAGVMK